MSSRRSTPRDARLNSLGSRLVPVGTVAAVAGVALAVDPWGANPFGPAKLLVMMASALMVAVGLSLDRPGLHRLIGRLRGSPIAWSAAVLWGLVLLSTLTSIAPRQSVLGNYAEYQGVITWFAVTVIALGAASLDRPGAQDRLGRAASISVLIIGLYALAQFAGLDPMPVAAGSAAERVRSTLGNSSNAGVYLVMIAPMLLERARSDRSIVWKSLAWMAFVASLVMIMFTASRGAWLGLLAGTAIWLAFEAVRWDRRRIARAGAVAVVALIGVSLLVVGVPRLEKRVTGSSLGTVAWRLQVWKVTAQMVAERPLLGWGPNTFRYVYPTHRPRDVSVNTYVSKSVGDPHNIVMSSATSLGVPGALGLLAILGTTGVACVRLAKSRADDDLLPVAIASALCAGLVGLMFHYATLDTMPLLALLLGTVVALAPSQATVDPVPRWIRWTVYVASVTLTLTCFASAGLVAADSTMRSALALESNGADWTQVASRLHAARALAPWEPSFVWMIGKAAVLPAGERGDRQAYNDGRAALSEARAIVPLDSGVTFDDAYLTLRFAAAQRDPVLTREAQSALSRLIESDPNNPLYWSSRALAEAALGRFSEAESDLREAVSLAPSTRQYRDQLLQVEKLAASNR